MIFKNLFGDFADVTNDIDKLAESTKNLNIEKTIEKLAMDGVAEAEIKATLSRKGYTDATIESAMAEHADTIATKVNTKETVNGAIAEGIDSEATETNTEKTLENTVITEGNTVAQGKQAKALSLSIMTYAKIVGVVALVGTALFLAYKHANRFNDALEKSAESYSEYTKVSDELDNLQSKFDDIDKKINELQSQEKLTISDEAELERLQAQNRELERQIELKEKAVQEASEQNVDDAMNTLGLKATDDLTQGRNTYNFATEENEVAYKKTDVITATKNELTELRKLKEERNKLLSDRELPGADKDLIDEQLDNLDASIDKYETAISTNIENINTLRNYFLKSDGTLRDDLTEDQRKIYESLTETIDEWNNIDLSEVEKTTKAIEDYFNGSITSSTLKSDILKEMSDESITASEALSNLGLRLSDLGIIGVNTHQAFNEYFDQFISDAKSAEKAAGQVEGSLESVVSALDTDNQDSEWKKMAEGYATVLDMYKKGQVGTDDFKEMAQFMSPKKIKVPEGELDATYYIKAFEKYNKRFKKYFDSENPLKSAANAQNKLIEKGLGVKTDKGIEWTDKFKSSADAAKAFGLSVEATEVILKNLEAYGAEYSEDIFFNGEGVARYESALEGVKGVYEELDDENPFKEELKKSIEKSEKKLESFHEDVDNLKSEKPVIEIEFLYSLAQLRKDIQDLQMSYDESGSYDDLVTLNKKRSQYNKELKKQDSKKGASKTDGYSGLTSYKKDLSDSIKDADSPEDQKLLAKQRGAILELETAYLELYDATKNPISFEEFFNSDEAAKSLEKIEKETGLTIDQLRYNLGLPVEFNAEDNVSPIIEDINKKELLKKNTELYAEDNATGYINLWNILEADPKFALLSAEDKATTVLEYWNFLEAEDKEALINSTITASDDGATDVIEGFNNNLMLMDLNPEIKLKMLGFNVVDNNLKTIQNRVSKINNTTAYVDVKYRGEGRVSELAGTAHKDGTFGGLHPIPNLSRRALAHGTLQDDSWLKSNWETDKGEYALTGEVGQEIVVNGNRWWTVGDHGAEFSYIPPKSVVFNAEQSKQLLTKGHINGRGKAHLGGTAHLSGTAYLGANGMPDLNNFVTGNNGSSSNKNNNNNKNNKSNDKTTKKTAEKIDWIVRKIQALEREISNLDKIASATYLSWSERNTALGTEIDRITNQIDVQYKAYERYLKEANKVGLKKKYRDKVEDGTIDIESIKSEKLRNQISEYQEYWDLAQDAYDKMQDLQSDRAAKAIEQFELVATQFENELSLIEHETSTIENMIDNIEARGYMVSSSMYDELAKSQGKELAKLQAERDALQNAFDTALEEGRIEEYSEDWYSMYSQILDVDSAIQDMNTSLIETANNAREADWALFDKTQELIGALQEESDWLIDLMSSKDMFNDDASITDEGKATLGLHSTNYNAYMFQANAYAKELKKINEEIAKDPNNTTLLDRRKELLESQRDMISAAEDEKEAIKDLISEGFDMYLDSMNKLIDKRKEWLSTTKDLYDYEKNVKDQVGEIAKLEKQLAVYSGDTSEESRSKIQQTEEELRKAREELEETEYDRYIQDQEQMLDKLSEDTQEWIDGRLDDIDGLLKGVIEAVNNDSETIKSILEGLLSGVGAELSKDLSNVFSPEEKQDVVSTYDKDFDDKDTTVNKTVNSITDFANTLDDYGSKTDKKNDAAKNTQDTSVYVELKDALKQLSEADMSAFKDSLPVMSLLADGVSNMANATQFVSNIKPSQNIVVEIGDILMEGVNDPATFAIQLKDALLNNKMISNIIQADTLGAMLGKNSLSKFKY